jgi:predicted transposase YbfD/YdcC
MVSVWDAETRLSLATRHAPGSNEVAATLAALKGLVLKGCIVTGDALHCHPAMAAEVRARGAHYALKLKANNAPLFNCALAELQAAASITCRARGSENQKSRSGSRRSEWTIRRFPMDGERDRLPGEHLLSQLAHLFNPKQTFLFHHLSDCFFRKARLPRYPIVQVTPGNGRRVQVVGGDLLYGLSDVFGRVHRESPSVFGPEDAAAIFPQQAATRPLCGICRTIFSRWLRRFRASACGRGSPSPH